MTHVVVVGGGQAAVSVLAKLRSLGFDGRLTLLGDEDHLPYQRPALSKKYLLGELSAERLLLRPASFYQQQGIAVLLGQPVTAIDTTAQCVLRAGEPVPYDRLVLATGSRPRRLPAEAGGLLDGVHAVRSRDDVDALATELLPDRHLLVVGGGYVGLEAAAVAIQKGLRVTVVEFASRILARVAAPETARLVRELHERRGVRFLEGRGVERLLGTEGRVHAALLTDGTELGVDCVVAGIGIEPATALAASAGIRCDNGISVDAHGRTSAPQVWAAGDCASFPWRGARIRLESVQNAIDQAEAVALDILGRPQPYDPVPWFWSDQYDSKLQIAGLGAGHDCIVLREGPGKARSVWYFQGSRLCAVDAIDDARSYLVGRQMLQAGLSPEPHAVRDPAFDLRSLLAAATRSP
ncbi:MAG TPA: FAD-dependent oxidoreductase [Ramlibacter sp.]|nr:FAD-dependent oxidoreductase [Ramlibacter sp.]